MTHHHFSDTPPAAGYSWHLLTRLAIHQRDVGSLAGAPLRGLRAPGIRLAWRGHIPPTRVARKPPTYSDDGEGNNMENGGDLDAPHVVPAVVSVHLSVASVLILCALTADDLSRHVSLVYAYWDCVQKNNIIPG